MLAKMWKKVLLAACIIACLFNIMSKLVSRTSLELNLKSVENGESILSVFKQEEKSDEEGDVTETQTPPEENTNNMQSVTEESVESSSQNPNNTDIESSGEKTQDVVDENSPITDFVVIY